MRAAGGDVRFVLAAGRRAASTRQPDAKSCSCRRLRNHGAATAWPQQQSVDLHNFSCWFPTYRAAGNGGDFVVAGELCTRFPAAGHVCTVMATEDYFALAERYRVPIVVTGFELWTCSKAFT